MRSDNPFNKLEPLERSEQFETKGWNFDCNLLQTPQDHFMFQNTGLNNDLFESHDKKYCCFFYTLTEWRMSWYGGLIGIFKNKEQPLLITNPRDIFDYTAKKPVVFDGNILFLRKAAFKPNVRIEGYPFVIINLEKSEFGFLDFDMSSFGYIPVKVNDNQFKLRLDDPGLLEFYHVPNRDGEIFDIRTIKFYPLDSIDYCTGLYWEEKTEREKKQKRPLMIIYGAFNMIYYIVTFFFLMLAINYYNGIFIPDSWHWDNNGHIRNSLAMENIVGVAIYIIEFLILFLLLYFINKLFLLKIIKIQNAKAILRRSTITYATFGIIFLLGIIYICLY